MSKSFDKWLKRIQDDKTAWTENEIRYFRKQIGSSSTLTSEQKRELINGFRGPYQITEEQSKTGIEYLRRKAFKTNGKPRNTKDYPFSDHELAIIKDFERFEFWSIYDASNSWGGCTWYLPVYRVYSKSGEFFDYVGSRECIIV